MRKTIARRTWITKPRRAKCLLLLLAMAAWCQAAALAGVIRLASGTIDTSRAPEVGTAALREKAGANGRAFVIVQFDGPIQPEWLAACEKAGVRFHFYLPEFTYLATLPPEKLPAVKSARAVVWVGELPARLKIHPKLRKSKSGEVDVTILSLDDLPARTLKTKGIAADSERMTQMGWHDTRVTLPVSELRRVAEIWGVFHIEQQPEYQLTGERGAQTVAGNYEPGAAAPVGPGYADWLVAHGLSGAPGLVIQVQDDGLDQGIDTNEPGTAHPDILGRIAGISNPTADPLGDSTGGHGQINAGIIMGNATVGTTDADGYLLGQGVVPEALVFATKIFRNAGAFDIGNSSFTDLAAKAQDAGAVISSNSWGANTFGEYTADSAEFDALTRDADPNEPGNQAMTYFFAAGNDGSLASSIGSPATAKNVIAVGAGENSDADGQDGCGVPPSGADSLMDLINFSSRGPTSDGRLGVTVFAPGTHVQGPASTSPNFDGAGVCDQFWPSGQTNYARSSGTSHSCPTAAGAGAIVHEFLVSRNLVAAGGPSPALMRAILTNTATDMAGGQDGRGGTIVTAPNPDQGWGNVNLTTLIDHEQSIEVIDQEVLLGSSGEAWEVLITPVDPALPLKVTLAWTDPPANPSAAMTLVNDLDLSVTGNGLTFTGNAFVDGLSEPFGDPDRIDTLEGVSIENPSGLYTVRVEAFNLAADGVSGVGGGLDQDFALFVWNGARQSPAGLVDIEQPKINCSDSVRILVSDSDLRGAEMVTVDVTGSSGDAESLVLMETEPDSGVLVGEISTATGPSGADGVLQVVEGDTVTASYQDADNGEGMMVERNDTAEVDCTTPTITKFSITDEGLDSFTVNFETDEPARGSVKVGLSCGEVDIDVSGKLRTSHSITVSDLEQCTVYFVRAEAVDLAGNVATQDNGGACFRVITRQLDESFADDFEPTAEAGWTHSAVEGSDNWQVRAVPDPHSPSNAYSYEPGTDGPSDSSLVSPPFQGGGRLVFWHSFSTEALFDGAVLEISTDDGSYWSGLGPHFLEGGYNGSIIAIIDASFVELPAWTGGAFGPMSRVAVDLSEFPGTARVRFRFISDLSVPSEGWRIDDVQVGQVGICLVDSGQIRFSEEVYRCGTQLELTVYDLNVPSGPLMARVVTGAGDQETVMLTDPDADKVFKGGIPISAAGQAVAVGDATLQGSVIDTIDATYSDDDDGMGVAFVATDTALLDCEPPVISNVMVTGLLGRQATVTFQTSEPTTTQVRLGLECGVLNQDHEAAEPETRHEIILGGLNSLTTYFFTLEVSDAAGNTTVDDNGGACHSFTTLFQVDYFTEPFDATVNDLENQSLILTPDGSLDFYFACRQTVTAFPTDPSGGNLLSLGDDDFAEVTLTDGAQIQLYGASYDSVFVGSNGYLTFEQGDTSVFENPLAHFRLPRVSGLFDDLDPSGGGTVSWKQLSDRLMVTFEDVPQFSTGDVNSFQVELHFDGTITLTYLMLGARDGLAGLSRGGGTPQGFSPSDLSLYQTCLVDQGTVRLTRPVYACGDTVEIEVRDLNAPPGPLTVTLNTQAGDVEDVMVSDPENDKTYGGSIIVEQTDQTAASGDGVLQGHDGEIIRAVYLDADEGSGMMLEVLDTAILDCLPPVISNVMVTEITGRRATVTIQTNEPTTARVRFGLSCGTLNQDREAAVPVTENEIILSGLDGETTYFFTVEASDSAGNTVTDDNGGACHSFTTPFQVDYFTELFGLDGNDLQNHSLILTPDGSANFYSACRQPVTAFPTDPGGGNLLSLADDGFQRVSVSGGAQVKLYGESYASVFVGSNGYLTFGQGDTEFFWLPPAHFNLPRVSGLLNDLNPTGDGAVSWKQLSDRLAVTFEDVPEFLTENANTFQIELHFDGTITLTHLSIDATFGLVGLSAGDGVPADFELSDLSAYPDCGENWTTSWELY